MRSLADIVRHHAQSTPDNVAIHYLDDGRRWTFAELDAESNRIAQRLRDAGVGPQDRIAYLDKNAPEYFTYLFGGAKLNAASVAVNWRLAPAEMEYILENSEAKVLLVGEDFLGHLAKMTLTHATTIVVVGEPGDTGFPSYDQWLVGARAEDPAVPCRPDDTCYQLYTSGTTGLPKGVELTHHNFLGCLEDAFRELAFEPRSVNLVCMPLFHIGGSGWALVGTYQGAGMVLLRDVDLPSILRAIESHGATHAFFVPAVMQALLALPQTAQTDFATLSAIVYGASPITESVLVRAIERFQCRFFQAYGLTETTGGVCLLNAADHDPGGPRAHLLRSAGKPTPPNRVRIVDPETLVDCPDGAVGEVWVHGRQNMKGYWKNPEATARALTPDRWLRTGDAGYLRDGYLYIHDRVKDMIISGGENIYPAEIENVLMKHPGIADAAVIGVPSERWGETPKAIVVRRDQALTEQAVVEFCRAQLAHYKCPTSVDWMDAIPRNPSGKILKTELRKPYWAGRDRLVS
jgi:long-chain acyl-CoA synthetase